MSSSASCLAIQPNLAYVSVHKCPKLPGSGTSFSAVPLRNARGTVNGILVPGPSHSQWVGQTCLPTDRIIFGGRIVPLLCAYKCPKLPRFLRFGFSVFFKLGGIRVQNTFSKPLVFFTEPRRHLYQCVHTCTRATVLGYCPFAYKWEVVFVDPLS